ncbi:MAG: glycosyltransferase family 4 protein [Conexivisphaera sp.]
MPPGDASMMASRRAGAPNSSVISAYPLNSGIGTYSRRLFELGLHGELVMFKIIGSYPEDGFDAVVKHPFNPNGIATFLSIYFGSRWGNYVARRSLVHFTSPDWFHLARYNSRSYGTVHDLFVLEHPEWYTPFYRIYFRREMEAAHRLSGLVAVSRATSRAIRERFPDLDPVTIHNWTGPEFRPRDRDAAREALGLPADRRIVLSVGSDIPRKNLPTVLRMMDFLPDDYVLVRVGSFAFGGSTALARSAGALAARGRMKVIREAPRGSVPLYYNAADVLVAPSLDEGFDLPVIEAINSGIPVVASEIEVHREVMRGMGRYVDPAADPAEWAEAVRATVEDDERGDRNPWSGIGDYYREGRAAREYARLYGLDRAPADRPAPAGGAAPRTRSARPT